MMTSPKHQKEIRRLFVRLAFHVDPDGARFGVLARALGVNQAAIPRWIAKGRVADLRARDINHMFGDDLAPLKVLTGGKS